MIVGGLPWQIWLPLPWAVHSVVELVVDYAHPIDFRTTRWLWPYLILFYVGQWLLIGYSFLVSNVAGALALSTYFACLGATIYSYRRVGHDSNTAATRRPR